MGGHRVGERIDHLDGMTIEEAEHMMATRLYQNTARVHFNQHVEKDGRFGRRIIYGGHIISLARSLSFNGLANRRRSQNAAAPNRLKRSGLIGQPSTRPEQLVPCTESAKGRR